MSIYSKDLEEVFRNVKLRIGLRQQGHIPTVERMLVEGKTWDEIGKAIGWDGPTAQRWYEMDQSHHVAIMEELRIQRNEALDRITQLEIAIAAQPHVNQQVFCRWAYKWYVREVKDCTPDNCVWTAVRERVKA